MTKKKMTMLCIAVILAVAIVFAGVGIVVGLFTIEKTEKFPDGSTYVGEWRFHKANGQGEMSYADGRYFIGEWKDGKRSGKGTLTFKDGYQIVGEWRDDQRNGQELHIFLSGKTIKGYCSYDNNAKIMTASWPDGETYVGEWKDDTMDGQGTYTFPDGETYVGEWKEGKYDGQGTYTFPNGTTLTGRWEDGNHIIIPRDPSEKGSLVIDQAGSFSAEEARELEQDAALLGKQYDMDIVIVTTNDAGGKTAQAYADDFFDHHGYGVGDDYSGILFLIDYDNREVYISTAGMAVRYLTDYRLESILDDVIVGGMADDNPFGATRAFLSATSRYLKAGIPDSQITVENPLPNYNDPKK